MVVGRSEGPSSDRDRFYTWPGNFRISEWRKFYEDRAGVYPSWYHPEYPKLPKPGASASSWLSKDLIPNSHSNGEMRGAFGWFAAMLEPNANSQWIHGTLGWGADGDEYIQRTRKRLVNIVANPKSHGCTRLENRAVAFLQHLLPPGTPVFRVYAKEGLSDASLARYQDRSATFNWDYILTADFSQKSGAPSLDKAKVTSRGVSSELILEQGSYVADRMPTPVAFTPNPSWGKQIKGNSGNVYDVDESDVRGIFFVDTGTFQFYEHPRSLTVGGDGQRLPSYLNLSIE
jgi:hypothetical protein